MIPEALGAVCSPSIEQNVKTKSNFLAHESHLHGDVYTGEGMHIYMRCFISNESCTFNGCRTVLNRLILCSYNDVTFERTSRALVSSINVKGITYCLIFGFACAKVIFAGREVFFNLFSILPIFSGLLMTTAHGGVNPGITPGSPLAAGNASGSVSAAVARINAVNVADRRDSGPIGPSGIAPVASKNSISGGVSLSSYPSSKLMIDAGIANQERKCQFRVTDQSITAILKPFAHHRYQPGRFEMPNVYKKYKSTSIF